MAHEQSAQGFSGKESLPYWVWHWFVIVNHEMSEMNSLMPFGTYKGRGLVETPLTYLDRTVSAMPETWIVRRSKRFVDRAMAIIEMMGDYCDNPYKCGVPQESWAEICNHFWGQIAGAFSGYEDGMCGEIPTALLVSGIAPRRPADKVTPSAIAQAIEIASEQAKGTFDIDPDLLGAAIRFRDTQREYMKDRNDPSLAVSLAMDLKQLDAAINKCVELQESAYRVYRLTNNID